MQGPAGRGTGLTGVQSPGLLGVPEEACDLETAPAETKEGCRHPVVLRPEPQGDCDLGGGQGDMQGRRHGTANPQYATVADWIGDAERFPPIAAGETCQDVQKHRAAGLSPLNLQRIQAPPAGGDWRDWPAELVPECHEKFSGYPDVYGRLERDRLAPTLTTRCISYSNGRFGHPEQDRAISVREAACLQTFSNEFIAQLQGGLTSQARQVGNAVPMLLAQRFGEYLIHHVKQLTEAPVPGPPHSD